MNTTFYDLPPDHYPFTLMLIDNDTGELLKRIDVPGPGAIWIPAFPGRRMAVRMIGPGYDETTRPTGHERVVAELRAQIAEPQEKVERP